MSGNHIFHVIKAIDLNPERDVYIGLPVEGTGKQACHRVPIRSTTLQNPTARVQLLPGQDHVVQSTQGLRRLLLEFPVSFAPGVRVYNQEGDAGAERTNVSLGFALFDHRIGATPEETQVQANLDALGSLVRRQLLQCDRLRCPLKLGPARMEPAAQTVAADMLDLHVARPAAPGSDGVVRRYLYTKVVLPSSNAPEMFHTFFWTPTGERLSFDAVSRFQNFQVVPVVEIEDIFVNKAVRSLQLKLRECIVYPPAERATVRRSLLFPDQVCSSSAVTCPEPVPAPAAVVVPTPPPETEEPATPGDAVTAAETEPVDAPVAPAPTQRGSRKRTRPVSPREEEDDEA